MTVAACNLQRISRMLRNDLHFSYFLYSLYISLSLCKQMLVQSQQKKHQIV